MTRTIVTVIAFFLIAGAAGLLGAGSGFAPASIRTVQPVASAQTAETAQAPRLAAAAMIVLTAADTDRGRPAPELKLKKAAPAKTAHAPASAARVLPARNQYSDVVVLTVLIAGGFVLGLAGFVFGRIWVGIATAGFTGLAIGAAVYSFAFASQVAQPNLTVAAALLIFSASALAPSVLGRAGLAALRKIFPGQRD
ncbi:MAG: hypothetical protein RLT05_24200 [Bauldia litoralis]